MTPAGASNELERVAEKVRKLLRLAERRGGNEAEAASAAAKAQELLLAHNLTVSAVEEGGPGSGRREDARVRGGAREYERDLWRAVAELNFCFYFASRSRTVRTHGLKTDAGEVLREPTYKLSFYHRLVGRVENVAATKNMAQYLLGAVERLLRGRLHGDDGERSTTQLWGEWAIAYREGAAERIVEKLQERREYLVSEEQRKKEKEEQRAREAAAAGASASTALTIAALAKSEEQANYDFLHGGGAWAKKLAREAELEKRWADERVQRARKLAEAEALHAAWAAAHPEEAAADAAREAAEERRRIRNAARRRGPRAHRARETPLERGLPRRARGRRGRGDRPTGRAPGEQEDSDQLGPKGGTRWLRRRCR